jgi:hypothetical protein
MEIEITEKQWLKLRKAAAITEIQMLMGRYVSFLDQMDAQSIWERLFAHDDPDVSIELGDYGGFEGPARVKEFLEAFHAYLQEPSDKRGWMDFRNINTPYVIVGQGGKSAYASWSCFSPQAKLAKPYPADERILTAIWLASKYIADLVLVGDEWKFKKLREVVYIRAPFELGWVRQPDCLRPEPLAGIVPDRRSPSSVYHPDAIYTPTGLYNWGPFPPDEDQV